ncbi:gasdermin-E [Pipistrellus kuhlii]|uniref:Gasdermin E n=1 Tax=Pipistrellus kuhlii TaxID=59472 RepID=A0A7J7TP09_PIPKU|nr:gasdermin-E [Pipistrellus kuhlii]KAF6302282.1 gasdermin E [Pipistrellus kuhlii]
MFAKATKNFLREVDDGGDLIPVLNLNDSDKLHLLSLVTKKNRFWCWQRPKYQSLSVALGDVFTEEQRLSPVVVESDFVKYEGKFANHVSGAIETALGKLKLNVGGKGLVESESSFGSVKKQEVDLQQLLGQAEGRRMNLKSPLLQQVLERRSEVLCVLTQRILTTEKCVISEHVQVEEKCGGTVGIQTKTVQVSAKEDGSVVKDSSVVLEIPALTTIAYGVIELYVKLDGQFEFCLLEGTCSGFENERRIDSIFLDPLPFRELLFGDMMDAGERLPGPNRPLCILKPARAPLERSFRPFAQLPGPQRAALRGLLQAALLDAELLQALEQVCDDVARGLAPSQAVLGELKPPQRENLAAFLRLVGCSVQDGRPGPVSDQQLFSAAYILVSALAEMPDNGAALLGTCCELQIIPTLCHLLGALSAGGRADLQDGALAPLRDAERLGTVRRLLAMVGVDLERQQSAARAVTYDVPDLALSPLALYVSLSGLRALGPAQQ